MDTEKTFLLRQTENIVCRQTDQAFISLVSNYEELNRHLMEIEQLFSVFRFHIEQLFTSYEIRSDDHIVRREGFCTESTDFIVINSFVIALIGAGRSLADSIDLCVRNSHGENSEEYLAFCRECKNHIYDTNFSYRFFYELRNFSQHQHLPVSIRKGVCQFDFEQILNTPHFHAKKKMREEIQKIQNEVRKTHGGLFCLSFSFSLMQYISGIAGLYKDFWPTIKNRLFEMKHAIDDALQEDPEILNHGNPRFDGSILYTVPEKNAIQMFVPYSDTERYYDERLQEAEIFYTKNHSEFLELEEHFSGQAVKSALKTP